MAEKRVGKWRNHRILVDNRLCIFCPGGLVELETHVLMLSNGYSDLRSNLFHVVKQLIVNFDNLVVNSILIAILELQ